MVTILSAVTHLVACAAFGPCRGKRTGELSLARDLRERVPPASLLIGDKLFLAFAELYAITRRNTTDTDSARHWLVPARKNLARPDGRNQKGTAHLTPGTMWLRHRHVTGGERREEILKQNG